MKNLTRVLVTGAAGFIGAKTCECLLSRGFKVTGVDNLNDYYDPQLKRYRLSRLAKKDGFIFRKGDIENRLFLKSVFRSVRPQAVIHLAARAGVRYSLKNPFFYLSTNAAGTLNALELCRVFGVKKFVLASTSSLYAGCPMPFKETLAVNEPISPYAATKKSAEALCYAYHHLYGIDVSVLRYFTVYGPAGRPDMSYFNFMRLIDEGKPVRIYGDGLQRRDFTFIDDIAEGTVRALKVRGYRVINLGSNRPHSVRSLLGLLEKFLGKKALTRQCPASKADMKDTWADIRQAKRVLGWKPSVSLEDGIRMTVDWYLANRSWIRRMGRQP